MPTGVCVRACLCVCERERLRETDRQTDRHAGTHADRHAGRHAGRQTDQTERAGERSDYLVPAYSVIPATRLLFALAVDLRANSSSVRLLFCFCFTETVTLAGIHKQGALGVSDGAVFLSISHLPGLRKLAEGNAPDS